MKVINWLLGVWSFTVWKDGRLVFAVPIWCNALSVVWFCFFVGLAIFRIVR